MSDRAFFAAAFMVAALLIALSFVWPQGYGRRSPGAFGGPEVLSRSARADIASAAKAAQARAAVRAQTPAVGAKK